MFVPGPLFSSATSLLLLLVNPVFLPLFAEGYVEILLDSGDFGKYKGEKYLELQTGDNLTLICDSHSLITWYGPNGTKLTDSHAGGVSFFIPLV